MVPNVTEKKQKHSSFAFVGLNILYLALKSETNFSFCGSVSLQICLGGTSFGGTTLKSDREPLWEKSDTCFKFV